MGARDEREADFFALFQAYEARLRGFAVRRTRSTHEADDVVSEVMAIAWRRLDDIPPDRALGWLIHTAIKVDANRRRSTSRRKKAAARFEAEVIDQRFYDGIDRIRVPIEAREALAAAWEQLDEDDREVLRFVAWDGLNGKELAAALDIGDAAARKRISRARAQLRRHYEASLGSDTMEAS